MHVSISRFALLSLLAGITALAQTPASFSGARTYLGNDAAVADFSGDGIPDLATIDQHTNAVHLHFGRGDGTFGSDRQIPLTYGGAGAVCILMASGDVNGDGLPDLVVGVHNPTTGTFLIQTLFGKSGGGLTPAANVTTTKLVQNLYLADMNKDGRLDLVVAASTGPGVFLGNGDGTFQPAMAVNLPTETANSGLAIGDWNGDGNLDLAVAVTGGIFILFGDGSGRFPKGSTFTTTESFGLLAAADLNGDGKDDLVIETSSKGTLDVLLGNGHGAFGAPQVYFIGGAGFRANGLAIGDVNGDGILDIVTPDPAVLIGNGDGTFAVPVLYPSSTAWQGVQLADLRGNGRLDIVGNVNQFDGPEKAFSTTVLLNEGLGKFVNGENIPIGAPASCIAVADFNGDGHDDLAVGLEGMNDGVALFFGTGGAQPAFGQPMLVTNGYCPVAGDFNNDGIPDLLIGEGATLAYLAGHGDGTFAAPVLTPADIGTIVVADFNGDGLLDIAGVSNTGIQVLLGNGAGGFSPWVSTPYSPVRELLAADLNGDGKPDLVATLPYAGGNAPNEMTVYLNQGGGVFTTEIYTLPKAPASFSRPLVADLNKDGIPDLVVIGYPQSCVFLGQGGGAFLLSPALLAGGMDGKVVDVNGDGNPDLVVVDGAEAKVFLGTGTGTFVSPGIPGGMWFAPPGPTGIFQANLQSQTNASGLSDFVTIGYASTGYFLGVMINNAVTH